MTQVSKKPDDTDSADVHRAWEIGKEFSPDSVCHHCARCPTGEMDGDTEILNTLKKLAGWREKSSGHFSPPNSESHELFCDELYPAFRNGFWTHCPPPEDCRVCSDLSVKCFHEREGLGGYCPYTGGNKEIY